MFYGSRYLHILQALLNHVMSSIDAMYLMVWWYQLPFTLESRMQLHHPSSLKEHSPKNALK